MRITNTIIYFDKIEIGFSNKNNNKLSDLCNHQLNAY